MARSAKSQWDFGGELFAPTDIRPAESVTELTRKLKLRIEDGFADRRVAGEVSNYRVQGSGHAYFVLKDAGAQLNCVLFRGQGGAGREGLRDGAQVILAGDLTVYEARGAYQLRVASVEPQGVGALQAAFEKLKARLAAEGLFDPARKRPIPPYPARIGIVTSPTGAALQDVLHVLRRRFVPEIVLVPVRVQGQGAAEEIAAAVGRLNRFAAQGHRLDLILVTRGGGSLEDLWCFNEEIVARAVAASAVPVVSAVGHEIDFTICDFASDLRAATPSAAAELISEHAFAAREFVAGAAERLPRLVRRRLERLGERSSGLARRLERAQPRRAMERQAQRVDELGEALRRAVARGLREGTTRLHNLLRRLAAARPASRLGERRRRLEAMVNRLVPAPKAILERHGARLAEKLARLRLLSPQNVLDRGYSLTFDAETGRVVRDAAWVRAGDRLRTRLRRGEVTSVATLVTGLDPVREGPKGG